MAQDTENTINNLWQTSRPLQQRSDDRGDATVLGRIDRYELVRELGGGGFGRVFLARDTVAGIDVAVKGLPGEIAHNPDELERVRENFALVVKLHHPHIAALLHLHQARQVDYTTDAVKRALRVLEEDYLLVMEYAPGATLNNWRKQFKDRIVPVDQALAVCGQVAGALDYAHERKIVHRDVKPANVMAETTNEAGRVLCRVLDFGLAAEIRASMGRVSRERMDLSGTRPYMAPEQWQGERADGRTDQYALAVMLYDLLTGDVPFAGAFETSDPIIMANAVISQPPATLDTLSSARNAALLRALSKKRTDRFGTCTEFIQAMRGETISVEVRTPPPTLPLVPPPAPPAAGLKVPAPAPRQTPAVVASSARVQTPPRPPNSAAVRPQAKRLSSAMIIDYLSEATGFEVEELRKVVDGFWSFALEPAHYNRKGYLVIPHVGTFRFSSLRRQTIERARTRQGNWSREMFTVAKRFSFTSRSGRELRALVPGGGDPDPAAQWYARATVLRASRGLSIKRRMCIFIAQRQGLDVAVVDKLLAAFFAYLIVIFCEGWQEIAWFRKGLMRPHDFGERDHHYTLEPCSALLTDLARMNRLRVR